MYKKHLKHHRATVSASIRSAHSRRRKVWRFVRTLEPWFLLVIAIASGVTAVFALRANNMRMVELRSAVYKADKEGGDVSKALHDLREHVHGHMNTELASGPTAVRPPIQLKYTYDRLIAAQQARQKAEQQDASTRAAAVYSDAQRHCERTIPNGSSGRFRLDCIETYVKQHPVNTQNVVAPGQVNIPKNLYQFDFISPRWSPDLAGWSIVVAVVSLAWAVGIWLFRFIKRVVKNLRSKK